MISNKNTTRARATIFIMRNGEVLFCRQRDGSFLLPGGQISSKELPIIAAIRELHEETNGEAEAIRFAFAHQSYSQLHYVFLGKLPDGCKLTANSDVEAIEWVPLMDVLSLKTSPATKDIFRTIISKEILSI